MWGVAVNTTRDKQFFKTLLNSTAKVTLEEAIFRSEKAFAPANLKEHMQFWEEEILKEHPHKKTLLSWIQGVKIEEFLNSFTDSDFQGIKLHSHYPHAQAFPNYVPAEFEEFMDKTVSEWASLGVLKEWNKVRQSHEPHIPEVVSPLGVEPSKPRALWDGRFVNEFCRDMPFTMDNATKVAEVSWENAYFFKLDHKSGYQHVPLHRSSWKFFGVFWKGTYYVFTVLPFGWKSSPIIYHTLTEAVAMYLRSLGIPMLVWIDDMFGMTQFQYNNGSDEDQFQSAMRAMVVTTWVLFLAGYFLGIPKCFLIPEQVMTYLGIDCDSHRMRFTVPESRVTKYIEILQSLLSKHVVFYAEVERIVGKLVSLECAVPAGMWYTRHQYAAMTLTGLKSETKKRIKNTTPVYVSSKVKEEWYMWVYFLQQNKGSPWKNLSNIFVQADVYSDASGRCFAGIIDVPNGTTKVTSGEFNTQFLSQDIQVKEGEALRATLAMIVNEMPELVKGKTLVCKIDNQVVKAVLERKGTSHNLALNEVGKKIWDYFGPFQWDLMATSANVNKDLQGKPLLFFSRYYDEKTKGVDLFKQHLHKCDEMFCFPPLPMVSRFLKYLEQQKVSCVVLLPKIWAHWSHLVQRYKLASFELAQPFNSTCFTITHAEGKTVPKKFPHSMEVVYLCFQD